MKRLLLTTGLCSLVSLGYAVELSGQEAAPTSTESYDAGELVEIEILGDWVEGIVVQPASSDGFRVKFDHQGRRLERTIPLSKMRRPSEGRVVPLTALRVWQDSSGKHSTKARLLAIQDSSVHLMKEDGSVLDVPIDRLSRRDVLLVRRIERNRPRSDEQRDWQGRDDASNQVAADASTEITAGHVGRGRATVPTQDHPLPADDIAAPGEPPAAAAAASESPSGLQSIAAIGVQLLGGKIPRASTGGATNGPSGGELQLTRDASWRYPPVAEPIASVPPQVLSLSKVPASGYVINARLFISPAGRRALGFFDFEAGDRVVAFVDLDAAVELAVSPIANLRQAWDLDPSGESLVGLLQDETGATAVAVWSLGPDRVELAQRIPTQPGVAVRTAHFLDHDHLVIVQDDKLECFQLDGPGATPRYQVAGPIGPVAWRADRRVAAVAVESGIALVDLTAAAQVGWLSLEAAPADAMDFSPDGGRLFASTNAGLRSWDLDSGTPQEPILEWAGAQRLAALADGYLLADGTRLFNTATSQETWQYQPADDTIFSSLATVGGLACYLSSPEEGTPSQLVILALPDPEAAAASAGREQRNGPGRSMLGRQGAEAGGEGGHGH